MIGANAGYVNVGIFVFTKKEKKAYNTNIIDKNEMLTILFADFE